MVRAQGGDEGSLRDPGRLPTACVRKIINSPTGGLVGKVDARTVADAALALGAGREQKGDSIDPAVGIVLDAKVGQRVERGQPLATIHANDHERSERAERLLREAFRVAEEPAPVGVPLIRPALERLRPAGKEPPASDHV